MPSVIERAMELLERLANSSLTYDSGNDTITGGAGDRYTGLDRFGRIVDQKWQTSDSTPSLLDDIAYSYDRNSNRIKANVDPTNVLSVPTTGGDQDDQMWVYDDVDRLVEARRGTVNASTTPWTMTSVATLAAWALDTLGNTLGYMTVASPTYGDANLDGNVNTADQALWSPNNGNTSGRWTDVDFNGDGVTNFSDFVIIAQHNNSTGGNTPTTDLRNYNGQNQLINMQNGDIELAYDDAGNQTFDQNGYRTIYDAWNRPTEVRDGVTVLTQYTYDGLGRRITEGPSGSATHNYYNANWQLVQQNNASGVTKAQYVWSPVYIDALILRDRDADNSTVTGTDGLEERVYSQWDANFNVTSLVGDTSGTSGYQAGVIERYRYEPYGERTVLNADFTTDTLAGSDGTTSDDSLAGWNKSDALFLNGHQGGMYDAVLDGEMRFRNRTLEVEQMRWEQVDPLGYSDGPNLYTSFRDSPVRCMDPNGESWIEYLFYLPRPFAALTGSRCKDEAEKAVVASGYKGIHNGQADAFRHCVWSCCMAKAMGKADAQDIGDIHELTNPDPASERRMDVTNNEVGRSLTGRGTGCGSKVDCYSSCQDALDAGLLKILDRTNTDRVVPKKAPLFPSNDIKLVSPFDERSFQDPAFTPTSQPTYPPPPPSGGNPY